MKGTDWVADNRTDLNPTANTSTGLTRSENTGSDLVNVYGDEQSNRKTLTLGGKQYVVSRTGYAEKDVADYSLKNLKADASLYYRPTENTEIAYTYRIANQNNIYQRTNRFRFDDYNTQQHSNQIVSDDRKYRQFIQYPLDGRKYRQKFQI
jgi:iron complex outermembrane receptor protein